MVKKSYLWHKYIFLDSIHHIANMLHSATERLVDSTFYAVDEALERFAMTMATLSVSLSTMSMLSN